MESARNALAKCPPHSGQRANLTVPGKNRRSKKPPQSYRRRRKDPHENDKDDVIRTKDVSDSESADDLIAEAETSANIHTNNSPTSQLAAANTFVPPSIPSSASANFRERIPESEIDSDSELSEMDDSELALIDPQLHLQEIVDAALALEDAATDLTRAALVPNQLIPQDQPEEQVQDNNRSDTVSATTVTPTATIAADGPTAAENQSNTIQSDQQVATPPPSSPPAAGPGNSVIQLLSTGTGSNATGVTFSAPVPDPSLSDPPYVPPTVQAFYTGTHVPGAVVFPPDPDQDPTLTILPAHTLQQLRDSNMTLWSNNNILRSHNMSLACQNTELRNNINGHPACVAQEAYDATRNENAQLMGELAILTEQNNDLLRERNLWSIERPLFVEEVTALIEKVRELEAQIENMTLAANGIH